MNKKGFTLIELLVVIAIIGLLSTLAVVSLNNARSKSRDAKRVSDVKQIQTALELYYADQNGYPAGTTLTLGSSSARCLSSGSAFAATCSGTTYMGNVPANPLPNGANYVYNVGGTNATYTITFTLEGTTGDLGAGAHTASQSGIN
jgi:general secretion pathway protein G